MNPNEAPIHVLHKTRLTSIIYGMAVVSWLWLASYSQGQLRLILVLGAGLILLYFLFFEIQTIKIFPTYLSINYICRTLQIEHSDIDYVSKEHMNQWVNGVPVTTKYVNLMLKNGRKIRLAGLREGAAVVYETLKAWESTNEDFLKGRQL
jgi:hypothetical protein